MNYHVTAIILGTFFGVLGGFFSLKFLLGSLNKTEVVIWLLSVIVAAFAAGFI